ncbi:hypothetical protein MLD38_029342 [Melastoma candidum]|uniref:Uncharacterized protein n=1 Tax=Melastoma candidum TaxID=119954 RepID=A0ACB9N4L6_9MYRT|nr:hypothetical protein MLD38_029342 [Melastoma candidum]
MQENDSSTSPELLSGMKLHGFLLWASLGFLMPVGVLAIRVSRCEKFERRIRLIFRVHVALQIASAVVATTAAAMSIKNFDNSFNNWHQRIGMVLYGAIWLQVLIGFLRPQRQGMQREVAVVFSPLGTRDRSHAAGRDQHIHGSISIPQHDFMMRKAMDDSFHGQDLFHLCYLPVRGQVAIHTTTATARGEFTPGRAHST